MNSTQFENDREERWRRLKEMVEAVEKGRPAANVEELPTLFRQTCHDLSLAQHRMYGGRVVDRLNALAISGYRVLERRASGGWERLIQMVVQEFPRAVRAEARLFWFCMAAFWLPVVFLVLWTPHHEEWAMSILGPGGMLQMEMMYGEGTSPTEYMRGEFGSDFEMFAFYIWNNVSINLRCFASGLLGGVGSLVMVLFNGAFLGAAAAYVNHACNPATFYSFVAGHSGPEIMGLIIAGMAGLRLGLSLVKPGPHDRKTALVLAGRKSLLLITGAAVMTTFAAVIEGFWSAMPMEPWIKLTFGGVMWSLTIAYLALSGREAASAA